MSAYVNDSLIDAIKKQVSTSFWPLLIAASALILLGIGLRDPWPADEPRFALIAKEMVETGQWFFPARAQELYPDKPPIFMWTIALFYWMSGSLRISFLLPSALSALLTIFLVYDISKRLWNTQTALVAGWLLLFSLQFILQAKTAQIDAMVCAWITIGCYGLLRYCLVDGNFKWYAMAWFFMGIGVITKGVGFLPMLMLLPYIVYHIMKKSSKYANQTSQDIVVKHALWTWFTGPLFMLFAICLWFVPMLLVVAQSDNVFYEVYRDNILFKQTVTRYTDSWHHIKPAWYYLTSVIPVFWLPSILALPWLFAPWFQAIKRLDPRIIMPLGFVFLVILFFSISPGKRGVYLLPALPMFVLTVSPFFGMLSSSKILRSIVYILCLLLPLSLLTFAILGHFDIAAVTKVADKFDIKPWLFFFIIGMVGLWAVLMLRKQQQWLAWPIFMSLLWATYSTYGYVLRNEISTPVSVYNNVQSYMKVNNIAAPELILINFSEQFILFSPYPIVHFGYNSMTDNQLYSAYTKHLKSNQFVLIDESDLKSTCYELNGAIDVGFAHRRHWVLVPLSAKNGTCEVIADLLPAYRYALP